MLRLLLTGLTTLLVAYLIYKLLTRSTKKHGVYTQPVFGFTYWSRWARYSLVIWLRQLFRPKRIDNYDPMGLLYELCGLVPTPSEVHLESPKILITDRHDDNMLIWGADKDHRCIVAKVVRMSRRRGCVTLLLKDEHGVIYTLPNQPDSNVINIDNEHCWTGNGLLLECVEPMRTWRVKFNGFLRRGTRSHYITNDLEDDDEDDFKTEDKNQRQIVEVRLDFLWKAMRAPVDLWRDMSPRLLAHALARKVGSDTASFKALDRDGYDQWGVLHGSVQIGDEEKRYWYLRGGRQHRWGISDSQTNLYRSLQLFTYFESGDIAWIEAFSYRTGISHCVLGYVQASNGTYLPVTSTSLELSEIGENGKIPKNVFADFTVGGKNIHSWHRLCKGVAVHSGDPWTLRHDIHPTAVASTRFGDGWGIAMFCKRFTGLCPVPELENLQIPQCQGSPPDGVLVLPLSDISCTFVSLAGGKGASLACLADVAQNIEDEKLKFIVPDGVVITNDAWRLQLKECQELSSAIQCLENAITSSQRNQIQDSCNRIQLLTKSMTVCSAVAHSLHEELQNLFKSDLLEKRFAVRSSACGEDSAETSAAGQNETFLGCIWGGQPTLELSTNTVLRAVASCWGSQFTFQSVEYKRQRGQPLDGGMAVVVQEMVPSQMAGVMFTRDPVTSSPASITISANYGLGESVVSASSEPDTIQVRRTWRNKLKIRDKTVGEKKTKCVMKEDGGTTEEEVKTEDRREVCLSEEVIMRLAKIGIYVEHCYGSPRDLEFAVNDNTIYLLQARPITSLNQWTEYELIHEADAPIISDQEILTVANTGEVFPGYTCPLTISTVVKMLDISIQKVLMTREWPRYKLDLCYFRTVGANCCRTFINCGESCYRHNDSKISMTNNAIDLSIFGRLVTTQEIQDWAIKRYGILPPFGQFTRLLSSFSELLFNPRRVNQDKSVFSNFDIDTNRAQSSVELFKEICRRIPETFEIMKTHCHTSAASTMTQCIALVAMAETKGEINDEMIQDMASLLSCISDSESADVPASLKALAETIASNEEVEEFLSMNPDEGKVWLETHPDTVGSAFRSFISKHGHRCIKELDLRSLSWGIAPEGLVSILQTMVRNPESFRRPKEVKDVDRAFDAMKNQFPPSKRRVLKIILKICGSSVNLREATKSMVIRTLDAFRRAYRTLGLLMVSECRLPDADLIFFLHHREIEVLLKTRSAALVAKATRRRKLTKQLENYRFEEICFGVPRPISSDVERQKPEAESNGSAMKLLGTPVCQGVAVGPARVVTQLEEASSIQIGDILVTYSTDVGWTPYFPLLSGVVTEIGGLISHGAVVAREYGLPCVVGVKGAPSVFASGDTVMLDGKEGFVKLIRAANFTSTSKMKDSVNHKNSI